MVAYCTAVGRPWAGPPYYVDAFSAQLTALPMCMQDPPVWLELEDHCDSYHWALSQDVEVENVWGEQVWEHSSSSEDEEDEVLSGPD